MAKRFFPVLLIIFGVLFFAPNVLAVPAAPSTKCQIKAEVLKVEKKQTASSFGDSRKYLSLDLNVFEINPIEVLNGVACDDEYKKKIASNVIYTGDLALEAGKIIKAGISLAGDEVLGGYFLNNVEVSDSRSDINSVLINELFYQKGAATTKLSEIKDPSKVEDLTFDLLEKVKVKFTQPVDLSKEEAVDYIANLADYMTFDYLYFWVSADFMSYFKVPLEVTFYDLPFVWDPDIMKDESYIFNKDEVEGLKYETVDDKPQMTFIVKETGGYNIVPHLELYLEDNQEIKTQDGNYVFTGRISDPLANLTIKLNNQELKDVKPQIDPKTGEFSFSGSLVTGSNLIEIKVQSEYGEIPEVKKMFQYQAESGGQNNVGENKFFNPIYYVVIILGILAVVLLAAIIYLVKTKKK